MTPDQLLLLHRIMQLTPAEMTELRNDYRLYLNAIDKLRGVVGKQTNAECLASVTETYQAIVRA